MHFFYQGSFSLPPRQVKECKMSPEQGLVAVWLSLYDYEDAKWKRGTSVVVATPSPINPLKTTLGLSVIHSMAGAQCRGPQTFQIPHPPTFACDTYNNTPVPTGQQTESLTLKPPVRMRQIGLLFSISHSGMCRVDFVFNFIFLAPVRGKQAFFVFLSLS